MIRGSRPSSANAEAEFSGAATSSDTIGGFGWTANDNVSAATRRSQSWVHRLALQRQHAEHTLVYAAERLVANEAVERLDPQRELPERQRPLCVQAALAQPRQVLG